MALKQMTFNEKRKMKLNGILESLMEVEFYHNYRQWTLQRIINDLHSIGVIPSNEFINIVHYYYGSTNKDDDDEYLLAKILTIIFLIRRFVKKIKNELDITRIKLLLDNSWSALKKYMLEYTISINTPSGLPTYEPIETKTVIDNLKDIPESIADPIAELLSPLKNENELIGLISKVYKDIEKIPEGNISNLNDTDKNILKKAQELAKMIVNKVDAAKGHKGTSELTIKDIAHNFALNASLIQKLIQINKDKSN